MLGWPGLSACVIKKAPVLSALAGTRCTPWSSTWRPTWRWERRRSCSEPWRRTAAPRSRPGPSTGPTASPRTRSQNRLTRFSISCTTGQGEHQNLSKYLFKFLPCCYINWTCIPGRSVLPWGCALSNPRLTGHPEGIQPNKNYFRTLKSGTVYRFALYVDIFNRP